MLPICIDLMQEPGQTTIHFSRLFNIPTPINNGYKVISFKTIQLKNGKVLIFPFKTEKDLWYFPFFFNFKSKYIL